MQYVVMDVISNWKEKNKWEFSVCEKPLFVNVNFMNTDVWMISSFIKCADITKLLRLVKGRKDWRSPGGTTKLIGEDIHWQIKFSFDRACKRE